MKCFSTWYALDCLCFWQASFAFCTSSLKYVISLIFLVPEKAVNTDLCDHIAISYIKSKSLYLSKTEFNKTVHAGKLHLYISEANDLNKSSCVLFIYFCHLFGLNSPIGENKNVQPCSICMCHHLVMSTGSLYWWQCWHFTFSSIVLYCQNTRHILFIILAFSWSCKGAWL